MPTAKSLIDALEPMALANGLELVDIELVGSKKAPTIRIYLDKDGGIGFDDLVGAHVWIDAWMDEHDPFPGAYTLEVSSPGIDRPLRKPEDFVRFSGETVAITTIPIDGRGKWTGTLLRCQNRIVSLDIDGTVYEIPFEDIKKANIKAKIDFNEARSDLDEGKED